jgi:hypothetical protein
MKREVLPTSGTYHLTSTDGYQLSIAHLVVKVIHLNKDIRKGCYHATYHHHPRTLHVVHRTSHALK